MSLFGDFTVAKHSSTHGSLSPSGRAVVRGADKRAAAGGKNKICIGDAAVVKALWGRGMGTPCSLTRDPPPYGSHSHPAGTPVGSLLFRGGAVSAAAGAFFRGGAPVAACLRVKPQGTPDVN